MEIRELNLVAFGPFSDRLLDFSTTGGGLHIVYGPNEAGKSSSLRGLKALLFGIPSRTNDNFLHDNKDLRIGSKLRNQDGQELDVLRRKGNKNTLLSPDGGQLDDAVLLPFLHGVSAEVFEMLFGIDHDDLVKGGQEILEQKGDVGQALFAASMGSAALHVVLEQLESEAGELFKPGGSKPTINSALKEYSRIQKEIKVQSLSSREWGESRKALEQTNKELAQVQAELMQCKADHNRLRRIKRVLPKIVARREYLEALENLGSIVVLADDFGARRETARLELEKAQAMANSATANLNSLQEQMAAIKVNTGVLELDGTIKTLNTRLGGHRKALQDRPGLDAQRIQRLTDAEVLLRIVRPELTLGDAETLRPVLTRGVRITELGNQRQALTDRVGQSEVTLRETNKRLKKARASRDEFAEVGSVEILRKQILLARKQGDLDEALQVGRAELETLERACTNELARLGAVWQGTLDKIPGLPLPARESIDRFENDYNDLEQRARRLQEKQEDYVNDRRVKEKQLDEIQHAGAVPTEQDLSDVRTGRDHIWGLLRREWIDGETVDAEAREVDPERALPDVFEFRVIEADEVSDRLRRETGRVQQQASLLAALTDIGVRAEEVGKQIGVCTEEKQQLDTEWTSLWEASAIKPLTPREMRAWFDNMEILRTRMAELSALRRRMDGIESTRYQHIQSLQKELKAVGEEASTTDSLEALLVESETVANRIDELARQRQTLATEIRNLEEGLETAESDLQLVSQALDVWKREWHEVIGDLGLNADALPAEVTEMLENIRDLFSKLDDAENLRIRIERIDADADDFRAKVAGVVGRVAPDLMELPAEQSADHLTSLMTEAGKQESKRQQLIEQIQTAEDSIQKANATHKTMVERLVSLCQEAQCNDASELESAVRNSNELQLLRRKIEALEQELREIGEGMGLADLETEAESTDMDVLPGEIEALARRLEEELEPRIADLTFAKGKQQTELEQMDGSDDVALLAEEAQSVLIEIRSQSEEYIRVKLASRILRDEIERYRQQHQGPLLQRASDHFTVLTQGSFAGLQSDFNEKDEPVLVGVRPDGERVYVEGMSSGTRDQLFLALRLASLEQYMGSAEPMPFIVDDILVHFDDDRSKATLDVLAEFAEKSQIILFTHHKRLVEQAQALDVAATVRVHTL